MVKPRSRTHSPRIFIGCKTRRDRCLLLLHLKLRWRRGVTREQARPAPCDGCRTRAVACVWTVSPPMTVLG